MAAVRDSFVFGRPNFKILNFKINCFITIGVVPHDEWQTHPGCWHCIEINGHTDHGEQPLRCVVKLPRSIDFAHDLITDPANCRLKRVRQRNVWELKWEREAMLASVQMQLTSTLIIGACKMWIIFFFNWSLQRYIDRRGGGGVGGVRLIVTFLTDVLGSSNPTQT